MNKIFVVGCPRSGTTLVQQLLGAREDIYTCRETHFFQRIRRRRWLRFVDHLSLSQNNVINAFEYIRTNNELLLQHDPSRVSSFPSAVRFLDQLMTSEAQARDKLSWVEKTPRHLHYARLIKRCVPSAQFVHVLRNGKDVVASLVDTARRFPEAGAWKSHAKLDNAIKLYNRFLKESLKYSGADSHVFVQYEHILEDADQVRSNLFASLNLKSESQVFDLDEVHKRIVRGDEGWKNGFKGEIVDTRLIKYNQIFSEEQKEFINRSLKGKPKDLAVI